MNSSQLSVRNDPFGLAFAIDDIVQLRSWAQQRQLCLHVALDRVLDEVEFEEVLIVGPGDGRRPTLTIWRTEDGLFAQTPDSRPHQFQTMADMLQSIRPVQPRRASWLQRVGLRT